MCNVSDTGSLVLQSVWCNLKNCQTNIHNDFGALKKHLGGYKVARIKPAYQVQMDYVEK
jgi:hypothetical protein